MTSASLARKRGFLSARIPHLIVVGLMLLTSACASPYDPYGTWGPKTGLGAAAGAAAGGLLAAAAGGRAPGIAAGVLLGGLLGGAIGNKLDQNDRRFVQQTAWRSLEYQPSGTVSSWRNPDSGNYGTFTPRRTYQRAGGHYCREYQQTIFVGGEPQQAYGTACRQPDGQWRIDN